MTGLDPADGPAWPEPEPEPEPEPDSAQGVDPDGSRSDVPGGGIFTLEGRKAPGLYLVAWILSLGGAALTFVVGPMASADRDRLLLIGIGAVVLTLGLATAAGYQVVERRDRRSDLYRGPSPLLVFGVYFMAMSLVGLVLISVLGLDPDQPFSFFAIGIVQAAGYALVVWLFAVRTSALSWSQMGWPTWVGQSARSILRSASYGIGMMLPVTLGVRHPRRHRRPHRGRRRPAGVAAVGVCPGRLPRGRFRGGHHPLRGGALLPRLRADRLAA